MVVAVAISYLLPKLKPDVANRALGPQPYFELTDGAELRIHENSVSNGTITGTGYIQATGSVNFVNNGNKSAIQIIGRRPHA
jgi:hypothetical protein